MGIRLFKEPKLQEPLMFVGWPGIGDIGIIAVNTLRKAIMAEEFGEIDGWDFFYPEKVYIKDGLLQGLQFPSSRFYYRRLEGRDLIFFIGERQPSDAGGMYASGQKAYRMADLVVDVALRFGCRRIYTSGACVSAVHHKMKPRVCAVVTSEELIREVKQYPNTILMRELEGEVGSEGTITGLNGLLLAVAKSRGIDGACLMGEIPDWLSSASLPYPKASKSVLEVFSEMLGVKIDLSMLDRMEEQIEEIIEGFYAKFPQAMKEEYDQRKRITQPKQEAITIQAQIFIDDRYKKEGEEGGERPS